MFKPRNEREKRSEEQGGRYIGGGEQVQLFVGCSSATLLTSIKFKGRYYRVRFEINGEALAMRRSILDWNV